MTEKQLEDLAKRSAANFGPAKDMFVQDYGQILKNGEVTEAGKRFAKNFTKTHKNKLDVLGWLKDSAGTIGSTPFFLVVSIYAVFSHMFVQLYYDFRNNQYTVRK